MNLNQVTIDVQDLGVSKQFYQTLGLHLIVDAAAYARFLCPVGGATFSLHQVERATSTGTRLYFEVEDVDATVSRLVSLGITFIHEPRDEPWRWREAQLLDPNGHALTIYRAAEDRVSPPWRINTAARSSPDPFAHREP